MNAEQLNSISLEVDPSEDLRSNVLELERTMLAMPEHAIHIEPVHRFSLGLYSREITIPKDCTLTGKIHRFQHICVISKGDVSVLTDHGIERHQAPYTFVSSRGAKRAFYAHEETVFTTFHPNGDDETDVDKIEARLICPSFEMLESEEPVLLPEAK